MSRFNLICHGMMLFAEEGNSVRILIPTVKEHDYKFGTATAVSQKCKSSLSAFPEVHAKLEGKLPNGSAMFPHGEPLRDMISAKDHLVIRGSHVDVVPNKAPRSLLIPKPAIVRCFRPVEVMSKDIFSTTPLSVTFDRPRLLQDVVAFCYPELPEGTTIEIAAFSYAVKLTAKPQTLCIYAQSPKVLGDGWHPTAVNDLLNLKVSPGGNPKFNLSRVGTSDGAPALDPLVNGIETCHLRNLIELNADKELTDRTGCTGAFLAEP